LELQVAAVTRPARPGTKITELPSFMAMRRKSQRLVDAIHFSIEVFQNRTWILYALHGV
jgi:hypothetical protein